MKIVMTMLVRDEEDIIAENIEFHKAMGVDFFIVMDHRSVDGTPDILKNYPSSKLEYIRQESPTFSQGAWVTTMARRARLEYQADWVINNDADEFWMPPKGENLNDYFEKIPDMVGVVHLQRYDFVYRPFGNVPFYEAMIFKSMDLNWTKCFHRGDSDVRVEEGNHHAYLSPGKNYKEVKISRGMEILHFPIRRVEQYRERVIRGSLDVQNTPGLDKDTAFHWKHAMWDIQAGKADTFIDDKKYDGDRLNYEIRQGVIAVDDRLQKHFLKNPMPG